ncbi:hypothetical protein DL98DRAFT_625716, partial [Cadophora sp. DSE1049]
STLVCNPQKEHNHTFIFLHGRGIPPTKLAHALLSSESPKKATLQSAFPHAKLLFPTAPMTPPLIFDETRSEGSETIFVSQWFHSWAQPDSIEEEEIYIGGLNAGCPYLHKLLEQEIKLVGKKNVVLWGLRQGAAMALSTLLTWEGESFGAIIGSNGWLPFNRLVWQFANGEDSEIRNDEYFDPDNFWPKENDDDEDFDWPTKAIKYFRFEVLLPEKRGEVFKHIPLFLGQSKNTEAKRLGRDAKRSLDLVGAKAKMIEYDSRLCVHGYSEEMLDDIFDFLRDRLRK